MFLSFKMVRNMGLAIMVAIIAIMAMLSFRNNRQIINDLSEVLTKQSLISDSLINIRKRFSSAEGAFFDFIREKHDLGSLEEDVGIVLKGSEELSDLVSESQKELVSGFIRAVKLFRLSVVTYQEDFKYDPTGSAAFTMEKTASESVDNAKEALEIMSNNVQAKIRAINLDILLKTRANQRLVWKYLLLGVVSGIVIAFFMGHALAIPIKRLLEGTHHISQGDLSYRVKLRTTDELGQLAASFNAMAEKIQKFIKEERELKDLADAARDSEAKKAKELEEAYRKLENAQEILIQVEKIAAIDQLAAGVAHEVKNPLGIVLQGINYLEHNLSLKGDKAMVLDMIKQNIGRADGIVRGLVDFSKSAEINIVPKDINIPLKAALSLLDHRFKLAEVKVVKEFEENLPKALIDAQKAEQVFVNLFLNAIDAMPNGGKLTVRSYKADMKDIAVRNAKKTTERQVSAGEKAIVVEVEDTGIGISKHYLERIFDPFFSTKGPKGGSGLGLSVTKNIIDLHRGFLEVSTEQGKGSKFVVTLRAE